MFEIYSFDVPGSLKLIITAGWWMECFPCYIYYAGDTAQTIAKGLSFRFKDVQSLYYDAANSLAALEPAGAARTVPTVEMPALEQLGVNYRSHSGILRIANTVRTTYLMLACVHACSRCGPLFADMGFIYIPSGLFTLLLHGCLVLRWSGSSHTTSRTAWTSCHRSEPSSTATSRCCWGP